MSALYEALKNSYHDAVRKDGLIDFTKKIRTENNDCSGKYSVSQKDLDNLFCKIVWQDFPKKGGHRKLKNIVTNVVIEYKNHGNHAGIDPGAALAIFEAVQKHLNILCNDIFAYKSRNWKTIPDYQASLKRWECLKTKLPVQI